MLIGLDLSLTGLATRRGGGASAPDNILQENGDKLLLESGSAVLKNTSIPAQSSASALGGTELVAIVQGGVTKSVSINALSSYLRSI